MNSLKIMSSSNYRIPFKKNIMCPMALFLLISFLLSCQAESSFNLGSDQKDRLCILLDASPTVPAAFAAL